MRIGYSRAAVDEILDHYQELRCGIDPDPTCGESCGKTLSRYRAKGITFIEMAGEIAARVKLCGQDGMLCEERYGLITEPPVEDAEMERKRHIPLYEIARRINRVKWFCVGRKRKLEGYEVWKARTQHFHHYRLDHI